MLPNVSITDSVATPLMSILQERENKRQLHIQQIVEYVQKAIVDVGASEMEATYMTYKIGSNLLASVLEKYDQAMLVSDVQSIK